ncbi:amino acid adenylation domain-containing protein [Streptomyces sp. 2A115]|uniref:amino acid adenylation domain-containing protein n=1 Tax=Streptomyces sp. 2A115 TaxID=3457439 RepID=UPI003FD0AB15
MNDTDTAFDEQLTLPEAFTRRAKADPDAVAVVGDGFSLSYAELDRQSGRLAATLHANGVGRDEVVGILLERSPEMLVAILAVLKAGGAYLPVDPAYPQARKEFLLSDSGARLVLTGKQHLGSVAGQFRLLDVGEPDSFGAEEFAAAGDSRALAYVIYTSGSTGTPKGVLVEHRSVVNRLAWMQRAYPIAPGDVVLQKTPISFDVSVWELFWWMTEGATVCLLAPGAEKDPESLVATVERHGVSVLHFVPSMLGAFVDFAESAGQAGRLGSLRRVFASGEALGAHQVHAFRRVFGNRPGGPVSLVNLYGPTEATVDVSHYDCTVMGDVDRVPIGVPIDNTRFYVVDENLKVQPPGTVGELCVAGVQLARGYLHRPTLTAEKFVDLPFEGEERIYRTGDLARQLPGGEFEYLGRIDHQVKIRGFRIELGEIEHCLRTAEAVREAVVVAREEPQGGASLCGYVLLAQPCSEEDLLEHVARTLPAHLVPDRVVAVDEFPLQPNGKLDRGALLPPPRANSEDTAPRNPREATLQEIWKFVLDAPEVGVHDNFFALGGNSIHFITVLARANAAGFPLTFQQLFQHPTIAELAQVVGETGAGQPASEPVHQPFALLSEKDRAALPADAEDAYPLAMLQAGLIFQSKLARGSAQYHDIFSYDIQASFDAETFERAVRELVRANPIFRTSYQLSGFSEDIQIVHREGPLPLTVVDLREYDEAARRAWHEEWLVRERAHSFDWTRPGLVRLHVHILADDRYRYSISLHDSAVDGWSITLVHTKLFETYYRMLAGEEAGLADADNHLRRHVELEREVLASPESKQFWQDVLAQGAAEPLPRWDAPATQGEGVLMHPVPLPEGLSDQLRELASALAVPVKNVLMAAHVKVIAALTGQDEVLTGYEHSGRPEREGADQAIGMFLNTLPFRTRVAGGTWTDLVHRVRDAETGLLPHRRYPMAQMKFDAKAPGGPMFESIFNFTHFYPMKKLNDLPEFALLDIRIETETEFPLRAEFAQDYATDDVVLELHHHASEFSPGYIDRISGYYIRAMQLMVQDPAEEHQVSLLPEVERNFQLRELAGPVRDTPDRCFHQLFEEQVRATPESVALVHRGEELSYAALNRRANRVAHALLENGLTPEGVVAVATSRDLDWAVAVIGVLKAGGVYLPVDPGYPAERIATMVRQSGCRLVLTTADAGRSVQDAVAETGASALRIAAIPAGAEHDPETEVKGGHAAYVYFTSGSTGLPKGAVCEHAGMVNHLFAKIDDMEIDEHSVVLQSASQCFDISLWQLVAALAVGGRTVIAEQEAVADVALFAELLHQQKVSVLQAVPSYLDVLLAHLAANPRPLERLRRISVTGEAVKKSLLERWFARFPTVPVVNAYGLTETSDDFTHEVLHAPPVTDHVPVGRPVRNMSVYVLGTDGLPVPLGSRGEIVCSGVGTGRGYINDPGRTELSFATDPLAPGNRIYRTGDFGRWMPSGTLEFLGRKDAQVKVRGMRVETGEIEAVLLAFPGLRDAAVVVGQAGDQASKLVGFVVADQPLDPAEVSAFLGRSLPAYMIPTQLEQLAALPVTENGKVDTAALRLTAGRLSSDARPAFAAPASATEKALAEVWEGVLGLEPGTVGRDDHFFDLGGHSLTAMRVMVRVFERFRTDIPLRTLFDSPTVAALAETIEQVIASEGQATEGAIARAERPQRIPLSFAQQRMWFMDQLVPGSSFFNIGESVRLAGRLDVPALQTALDEVVQRHEVLRTRYPSVDGEPHQEVAETVSVPLETVRCQNEQGARAFVAEQVDRPFKLATGPVLRAGLVQLADDDHILWICVHHIAFDGWSIPVLFREISGIYTQLENGQRAGLDPLPVQYADFAIWHLDWFAGAVRDRQLDYWREQLEGAPQALCLPADLPRPKRLSQSGAALELELGPAVSDGLRELARSEGCTPYMVLLSLFGILLSRNGSGEDIPVATPIAGRTRYETEKMIGLFFNTLVLRLDLSGGPTFRELLRRTRKTALDAYEHQDLPFDQLVDALRPARDLSRNPLAQVMFQLLNTGREDDDLALPGVSVTEFDGVPTTTHLDLEWYLREEPDAFAGTIVYSTDLFERETIARLLAEYRLLAAEAVRAPDSDLRTAELADPGAAAQPGRALSHDETAEEIRRIWAAVLERDEISFDDDFFDLGGKSLLATRIVARISAAFGVDLPLGELFERSTIAGLADAVAELQEADGKAAPQ